MIKKNKKEIDVIKLALIDLFRSLPPRFMLIDQILKYEFTKVMIGIRRKLL